MTNCLSSIDYLILMNKKIAYFISDAHLGIHLPGCDDRESVLLSFLREISAGATHLFIVGDLFDFWIEYRHAIRPDYFRVLVALDELARSGTEIHYCLGNHDFAIGSFIEDTIGITVHPDPFRGTLQGKKLYVTHGDELNGNRILRRVLRNPILQAVYKALHPNLGVPLGEFFSRLSRNHLPDHVSEEILEEYRREAEAHLRGVEDIFIAGHTHVPELCCFEGGVYCNTGNWMSRYSFARLSDGEISLWQYQPGQTPRRLAP